MAKRVYIGGFECNIHNICQGEKDWKLSLGAPRAVFTGFLVFALGGFWDSKLADGSLLEFPILSTMQSPVMTSHYDVHEEISYIRYIMVRKKVTATRY